jgi:hypothetical protein
MTENEEDILATKEAEKYRKMWGFECYRKTAPGTRHVEAAIEALDMQHGITVIDFGTGTGRAAQAFKDRGYLVTGIDHAENCLDADVDIPLLIKNLWSLPKGLVADYGFCTDVMEHIPEEKVSEVFKGIAGCVDSCYFAIDTIPDSMGKLINDTLHLTVRPGLWWAQKAEEVFETVELELHKNSAVLVCKGLVQAMEEE